MRAIYAAIHELSPVLRDTVIAVDVIGLSYRQAALALDTAEGTIMSRLYRAREQVAQRLEGAPEAGEPRVADAARPAAGA
jgi:RNA polymerase sigma-70 factor (ECF subfamily)